MASRDGGGGTDWESFAGEAVPDHCHMAETSLKYCSFWDDSPRQLARRSSSIGSAFPFRTRMMMSSIMILRA